MIRLCIRVRMKCRGGGFLGLISFVDVLLLCESCLRRRLFIS